MGRSLIAQLPDKIRDRLYRRELTDIVADHGVVSFCFDDFPQSAFHVGAPIVERAGARATYYVCAGLLGTKTSFGRLATEDELKECLDRGHEVANHTLTHRDLIGTSPRTIREEIEQNAQALERMTRNFAFPRGAANLREQRIARKYVTTARGVQNGINGRGTDRAHLLANPIYSSKGIDRILARIEETRRSKGWLIVYTHDVVEAPSPFGCTPGHLQTVVTAVQNAGLEVRTIEDARLRFALGPTTPLASNVGTERNTC